MECERVGSLIKLYKAPEKSQMRNDLLNSGIFIHENSVDFEKIFE